MCPVFFAQTLYEKYTYLRYIVLKQVKEFEELIFPITFIKPKQTSLLQRYQDWSYSRKTQRILGICSGAGCSVDAWRCLGILRRCSGDACEILGRSSGDSQQILCSCLIWNLYGSVWSILLSILTSLQEVIGKLLDTQRFLFDYLGWLRSQE